MIKNENLNGTIEKINGEFIFTIDTVVVVETHRYSIGSYGPAGCKFEEDEYSDYEIEVTADELFDDYFSDEMAEFQEEHPEVKFYDENNDWNYYSGITEEQMDKFINWLYDNKYNLDDRINDLAQDDYDDNHYDDGPDCDDYGDRMEEEYYDALDRYDL